MKRSTTETQRITQAIGFERRGSLFAHVCVGVDLEQHVGINQPSNFDHSRSRADVSKELTVRAPDLLPVLNVEHEHARPYHVFHARPRFLERGLNIPQNLDCLRIRIADADDLSVGAGGRCAGYMNVWADPNGSGVTNYWLPRSTTGDICALHDARKFLLLPIILVQLIARYRVAA